MTLTIGYSFKNPALLDIALTHSSYAHEVGVAHSEVGVTHPENVNNERMEFLGDAVLELVISHLLYRAYPNMSEGQMTKFRASLVCEQSLATIARDIGLGSCLKLGRGEAMSGGNDRASILSDALEAVFGAVYLDGGLVCVQAVIERLFEDKLAEQAATFEFQDYKTYLQEVLQREGKNTVRYVITDASGPDHQKVFTAAVMSSGDEVLATGTGATKKQAEQMAAFATIRLIEPSAVKYTKDKTIRRNHR